MSEAPERIYMDPDIRFPECEKQYGCDVEYIRADLVEAAKRIWADGNVKYIRADLVEAAVKRALDGAADEVRGANLGLDVNDIADDIRALDPAQFIDGEK